MPGTAEWNNAGKDVVVLHMMERGRTRPNMSPFVLKFETFLKVRLTSSDWRRGCVINFLISFVSIFLLSQTRILLENWL